ncbi:MAG: DUF1080 domain-containing protein [Cyclobacteriaceae bacterium]
MKNYVMVAIVIISFGASAQQKLDLNDLSQFREQAGNWRIVGDVWMSPDVDIHHIAPENPKKKKKKSSTPIQKAVMSVDGTGILLNENDEERKSHLITVWEHGDIELDLDVMIPRGSNSGIYLQGRYEVQLLDSYGVENPSFSDIGGIYRNWESEPGKILKGIPPRTNAAKAPGLWQHFKIQFRAPKFDEQGNKTANARFVKVELNGITIHENVEVELPTGGPISKDEVPMGPIMIQGDHGPVAFKNIEYKLLGESDVMLKNISYKVYRGDFNTIKDIQGEEVRIEGKASQIEIQQAQSDDAYAIIYEGLINIPKTDEYTFGVAHGGAVRFEVDGEALIDIPSKSWRGTQEVSSKLDAGSYNIKLYNYKSAPWISPALGLFVKSKNTYFKPFHSYDSYPEVSGVRAPINVDVDGDTKLHRAFIKYRGASPKLSHTIGVGDRSGVHYVYDLQRGNLVAAWRGEFIDATPMWNSRGDGSFLPRGAVQWKHINQSLAYLTNESAPFPTDAESEWIQKGYQIGEMDRPIFKSDYKGAVVTNSINPAADNASLVHEIAFENLSNTVNLFYKIAEGSSIRDMGNGLFAVNDHEFYIRTTGANVRQVDGKSELIVPVNGSTISYTIVW